MTETPQVVQIARQGRAHTVEITDQVTLDLAKAWVRAWDALSPEFEAALARLRELAAAGGTAVITGWNAWSGLRVGDTYRTVEEDVHDWLGRPTAAGLRLAVFGGRELATGRLLLHLPHRFFVPAGTNAEHRLIWPRLTEVEPLPGRAVHISPAVPEPGMPCQLASPAPA